MCKTPRFWLFAILLASPAFARPYETIVRERTYTWTRSTQVVKNSHEGESTAEDFLEQLPGNFFSSTQSNTRVSFFPRGLSSQSIRIYVDGILLNDPADPLNRFDFSTFDWRQIESVEYNPSAALSGKPGGSLFIWTPHSRIKDPSEINSTLSQEITPPAESRTAIFSAWPQVERPNPRQWSFSASRIYSRNQSQVKQPGVLERDSLHLYPLRFSFLYQRPRTLLAFHSRYAYLKESLDDGPGQEDINATQISHHAQGKLSLKQGWGGKQELRASLQQNFSRRRYSDPANDPRERSFGSDYRSHSSIFDFENSFGIDTGLEFIPLFTYHREELKITGDEAMGLHRENRSLFGARFAYTPEDPWRIYLAARTDPSLGFTFERNLGHLDGHFYLNLAQASNRPTLYQKRAPIYGNPSLRTERISTSELGLKNQWGLNWHTQAAVFQSYGEEQIEFSTSKYQYENIGLAKIWGALLSLSYQGPVWDALSQHTYLNTELLRRSRWSHSFQLGRTFGPLLKSELSMRWNGRQRDSSGEIASTQLVDLKVLLTLKDAWRGWLKLQNLLNQKDPFVPGYSRRGFHASLGVEHDF